MGGRERERDGDREVESKGGGEGVRVREGALLRPPVYYINHLLPNCIISAVAVAADPSYCLHVSMHADCPPSSSPWSRRSPRWTWPPRRPI